MPLRTLTRDSLSSAAADCASIESLRMQINHLGRLSGVAQLLGGPITSADKLLQSDHTLILLFSDTDESRALGFIKYGPKSLFLYPPNAKGAVEQRPAVVCVLDFYCLEQEQRRGVGRALFDEMLTQLRLPPQRLAYDRPSPLLVAFMHRHFALPPPDLQPNRFALFRGFWD